MLVKTVILQRTRIRFIVTDDKSRLLTQRFEQWFGQSIILIPENTPMPFTGAPTPIRCKTVDRENARHDTGRLRLAQLRCNCSVIRRMKIIHPLLKLRNILKGIYITVRRYDCPVRQFHHQCRIIRSAIEINQQTGISCQHGPARQSLCQPFRDFRSSNVIGDVAREFFFCQPQCAIAFRQGI